MRHAGAPGGGRRAASGPRPATPASLPPQSSTCLLYTSTIAAGDSFNDLGMIQASKAGFLFKSTDAIKADHPEVPAYEEFGDLLQAIRAALD